MKRIFLNFFFLLGSCMFASAQLTTFKESPESRSYYDYELFRPQAGMYLSLEHAGQMLSVYDENLHAKATLPVPGLKKQRYLRGHEKNGVIYVFTQDKKQVSYSILSPTSGELRNTQPLYSVEASYSWFYIGHSSDSNYSYVASSYSVGKNQVFDGVIFGNDMKPLKTFSVKVDDISNDIHSIYMHQNPDGILLITTAVTNKRSSKNYNPLTWLITEVDRNGKSMTTYLDNLPQGHINNVIWNISREGMSFAGLRAPNKKDGYTSIVSGKYYFGGKVNDIKETDLKNAPYWDTVKDQALLKARANGFDEGKLINYFIAPDGTQYLVTQWFASITTQKNNTSSFSGNIFVYSIAADNTLNWVKTIPLSQGEGGFQGYTGSLAVFIPNKGVYVFYNDADKNQNQQPGDKLHRSELRVKWKDEVHTYMAKVEPDGTLTKTIAAVPSDTKFRLFMNNWHKLYGNELFYNSYKSAGKSQLKATLITLQ